VELILFDSAQRFYDGIKSFLLECEDENSLLIGILSRLVEMDAYQENLFLAAVIFKSKIVAVALHVPHRNLIITRARAGAIALLASRLKTLNIAIPGVEGPESEAHEFVKNWKEITNVGLTLQRTMRIYRLDKVILPKKVTGSMRLAQLKEMKILRSWFDAFFSEINTGDSSELTHAVLSHALEKGNLYLWYDGKIVSMAGIARSSPNGKSVNLVYTPIEHRGCGYASNLVASLSENIIQSGMKFCTLFADLKNPTSNRIYINIGYYPVGDFTEYSEGRRGKRKMSSTLDEVPRTINGAKLGRY